MVCRLCSRPVPEDALRCPHCHWTVKRPDPVPAPPAPPTCGGCARLLPDGATYCEYCGWSVDVGEETPPATPPPVAAPPVAVAPPVVAPPPPKVKPGELFQISVVPLTSDQKRTLIDQIVWPPLILIICAVAVNVLANMLTKESFSASQRAEPIPAFWLWLIGIVVLVGLFRWFRHIRDLGRGVAHVQLTRLARTSSQRVNKQRVYYGFFENLGKVAITSGIYGEGVAGSIYRLTYSPVSKRLWEAELIEQPAQPIPARDDRPLPH